MERIKGNAIEYIARLKKDNEIYQYKVYTDLLKRENYLSIKINGKFFSFHQMKGYFETDFILNNVLLWKGSKIIYFNR